MKPISLRATTAVALFLGATAAYAQMPQKEQGPDGTPGSRAGQVQQQDRSPDAKAPDKGPDKGDVKGKSSQGQTEPKNKKGTAQKSEDNQPKDKSAEKDGTPSDQRASKAGTQPRAELSEQQRTQVRESVLKQKGERVTNVNFSVSVGARVPRSVRLAPLPAAVIEIVPEYRSYRYVVVRDDVVIIDPTTYEIVYVLPGRSTTAGGTGLSLSQEQVSFVLRNIDLKSESRLGIGGLSVGATVSRDAELRSFPSLVVEKLPQLRSYRYLVHENEVAFVEPGESKVVLVTEIPR